MAREYDRKRRPPRRPRREASPEEIKEKIDRDFQRELEMRIAYFLQSADEELELEPMNSYRRRITHNLAKKYNMTSESRGEDRERYVCLVKTDETPPVLESSKVRLWDFGSQTFAVNPGVDGLRLALKIDGSLEIWREGEKNHIIAERLVTAKEVRIRKGQILVPGDQGY